MPLTIATRTENPTRRTKPDTRDAYIRMLEDRGVRYAKGEMGVLPSYAFVAVRYFNGLDLKSLDFEIVRWIEQITRHLLAHLTPRQLLNTFPPTKDYDGERYECKDYFSTMEAVRAFPMDEPIGADGIDHLLWDYMNPTISVFMAQRMSLVDSFLKSQGKPGMIESFFGIKPKYLQTAPDGKEYLHDPRYRNHDAGLS